MTKKIEIDTNEVFEKLNEKIKLAPDVENRYKGNMAKAFADLMRKEPFFANFSRFVAKRETKQIPTAAAAFDEKRQQMYILYNPEFIAKLTEKETLGLLIHEYYHIILGHIEHRADKENAGIQNIAQDLAINSLILDHHELPKNGVFPGKGLFKDFPSHESSEYYFGKIMSNPDLKKKCESLLPMDIHDFWKKMSDRSKKIMQEQMKNALRKSVKQSSYHNNWGSVSQKIRNELHQILSHQLNWQAVLRQFVFSSKRSHKTSSIRKINPRYPRIHAGRKIVRNAKIAVSIDESGSVSDELLEKFFAELNALSKFATFVVIPFDCHVYPEEIYEWKRGQHKMAKRVLRGGTNFDAPTKYVNDNNFDGHIICTDLGAPVPIASNCQRMWITTKEHLDSSPDFQDFRERILTI